MEQTASTTEHEHPDLLGFFETRRSPKVHILGPPAPSEDELSRILTIASRVPDHGKLVPWRFILIRGDRRMHLGTVIGTCFEADHPGASSEARAHARGRLAHAPLVIAVVFCPREHPKVPEWEQVLSAGAACMNLLHACRATGYAAIWLTEWYAFDRRVLDELGLERKERIAGFVHIGTESETRDDRVRPALPDIVTEY